ncbi:hypothetical protein [Aeromicrobium sp. CF3.5]|uniref:hypothetical protein n=1 Tax=Aeromicrobium sp. CF3.5 TaxID=3373078 RepID=UPI003EE5554B
MASSDTPEQRERARRRRAAELLGELVPQSSTDETSEGWNESGGTSREDELLRDVPPHHG